MWIVNFPFFYPIWQSNLARWTRPDGSACKVPVTFVAGRDLMNPPAVFSSDSGDNEIHWSPSPLASSKYSHANNAR